MDADFKAFLESQAPNPTQASLRDLLNGTIRFRILTGGMIGGKARFPEAVIYESSSSRDLVELERAMAISEKPDSFDHCLCVGEEVFEFHRGNQKPEFISLHHGRSLRCPAWKYDARLQDPAALAQFMKSRLDPVRRKEVECRAAQEELGRRIRAHPEDRFSYIERGRVRLASGDAPGAISDFTSALALDPKDEDAYIERYRAKRAAGDFEGALTDLDRAIAVRPRQEHYHARGLFLYETGNYAPAIESFTEALKVDRAAAWSYYCRGLARMAISAFDEAKTDLKTAHELGAWNEILSAEVPRLLQEIEDRKKQG
jgi:tetratricopeptide (TPR) repeat protein